MKLINIQVATIRSERNYIAQHRFKEALDLANKALGYW
jgi:hypothetical protein